MGDRLKTTGFDRLWRRDYYMASLIPCYTGVPGQPIF